MIVKLLVNKSLFTDIEIFVIAILQHKIYRDVNNKLLNIVRMLQSYRDL